MIVRRLTEVDAQASRELRLRALRDDPDAFGATYEEETQRPREVSVRRLSEMNADSFMLGAFNGDCMVGMVAVLRQNGQKMRHKSHIYSMYVVPEMRGQGLGKHMLSDVIAYACMLPDLDQLVLDVVPNNTPARSLYLALGFQTFGLDPAGLKLSDGSDLDLEYMYLDLCQVSDA